MKQLYTSQGLAALKRLALATQGNNVDLDIDDPNSQRGKEFRDAHKYADKQVLEYLSVTRFMSREEFESARKPEYESLYNSLRNLCFAARFRLHGVADQFVLEEANAELKKESDKAFEAIELFQRNGFGSVENVNKTRKIPCFINQDGVIHTLNPTSGKCTPHQDIEVVGDTVRILGAFDESDPRGQARLVVDEFTLYSSLAQLAQVLEEGLDVQTCFQNEKSEDLEIQNLMKGMREIQGNTTPTPKI